MRPVTVQKTATTIRYHNYNKITISVIYCQL